MTYIILILIPQLVVDITLFDVVAVIFQSFCVTPVGDWNAFPQYILTITNHKQFHQHVQLQKCHGQPTFQVFDLMLLLTIIYLTHAIPRCPLVVPFGNLKYFYKIKTLR